MYAILLWNAMKVNGLWDGFHDALARVLQWIWWVVLYSFEWSWFTLFMYVTLEFHDCKSLCMNPQILSQSYMMKYDERFTTYY